MIVKASGRRAGSAASGIRERKGEGGRACKHCIKNLIPPTWKKKPVLVSKCQMSKSSYVQYKVTRASFTRPRWSSQCDVFFCDRLCLLCLRESLWVWKSLSRHTEIGKWLDPYGGSKPWSCKNRTKLKTTPKQNNTQTLPHLRVNPFSESTPSPSHIRVRVRPSHRPAVFLSVRVLFGQIFDEIETIRRVVSAIFFFNEFTYD